jgi:hypothetical protein
MVFLCALLFFYYFFSPRKFIWFTRFSMPTWSKLFTTVGMGQRARGNCFKVRTTCGLWGQATFESGMNGNQYHFAALDRFESLDDGCMDQAHETNLAMKPILVHQSLQSGSTPGVPWALSVYTSSCNRACGGTFKSDLTRSRMWHGLAGCKSRLKMIASHWLSFLLLDFRSGT